MNNSEKVREYLNVVLAFALALIGIIIIGIIISKAIPDVLDTEYLEQKYIVGQENFEAEKSERMQYVAMTIMFPILYIITYKILQKINIIIDDNASVGIACSLISILAFTVLITFVVINTQINYYPIIVANTCIGIFLLSIYKLKKSNKVIKYITIGIITILICITAYIYVNPTFEQIHYSAIHADAYFYPILKINSGLTPYIDFNPIYGCYSYIYAAIQNIFNNKSILFFSIINAVLVAGTLASITFTIKKTVKNKIISFWTIISVIYFSIIYTFLTNKAPYLQYMPHRMIFPALILMYIVIYLKHRKSNKKMWLQIVGYIISAMAIFWNIETGLIILIVWTGLLIYEVLFFYSLRDKKTYISILKIILMMLMSIIAAYVAIVIITYIRSGKIPNIQMVLGSQITFYKDGFFMIKMNLWEPWMLIIGGYLIGLAISIRKLYFLGKNKRILFSKYAIIFALSILGIGIFSYYQGRSHKDVLPSVTYPCIMLLGIFADCLLKKGNLTKRKIIKVLDYIVLIIPICILSTTANIAMFEVTTNNIIRLYMNKNFLQETTILEDFSMYDTENIEFISYYESLYYQRYNLSDEKSFSAFVDVFTYEEAEKIVKYIQKTDKNIVTNKYIYELLKKQFGEEVFKNFNSVKEGQNGMILLVRDEGGEM